MRHSRNPASRHSAANYARENHESLISRTTFPRRMIGCPARIGVLLITITFRVCGVAVTADDDAVRNTEPGGILRIEIVMPGLILIDGSETRMLDVADSVRSRVDRDHVTDVWITAEKDVPYRFVTDVGGAASLDGEVALRIRVRGNNAPRRHAKKQRYVRRREHDPNGIGKFYMGREIARVMGFGFNGDGARWLERTEREEEERLTLLVRSLELRPGMVVADVGAGSGVISMLMAERILPAGYVIAVDVQDEMLLRLKKNIRVKGLRNIIPIKGSQTSPSLAPASVDLIIMVDVYHEFETRRSHCIRGVPHGRSGCPHQARAQDERSPGEEGGGPT